MRKPSAIANQVPLWIATWFGVGLLPWAPGTWGSLAALPCAWAIISFGGPTALVVASVMAFLVGCWASERVARESGQHDPGFIVIDEVAAQWLVLVALYYWLGPLDWRAYLAAFLLFRVFDIMKPWPARLVERRVKGGLGIMLDDIVAAIYAVAVVSIGEGVFGVRP